MQSRHKKAVAAFVAVQIAIPATMLTVRWINEGSIPEEEYPLSFQMYTTTERPAYTGTTADGVRVNLDPADLAVFKRAVIYGDTAPNLLCDADDALVTVQRGSEIFEC